MRPNRSRLTVITIRVSQQLARWHDAPIEFVLGWKAYFNGNACNYSPRGDRFLLWWAGYCAAEAFTNA